MTEAKLQAQCVLWYRNEWYKNPRNLWATMNEGRDVNTKRSMGMMEGVSDLLYFCPESKSLIAIEMKLEGTSHSVAHLKRQARWILDVPQLGGFCDSIEMFQKIIRRESNGIDPQKVFDYLEKINQKTITWKNGIFT